MTHILRRNLGRGSGGGTTGPPGRHGPALRMIVAVALVLALGILAVGLAWFYPQRAGLLGQEYAGDQVYAFEHLRLETEYLTLELAAGRIVPALSGGEVSGAVLLGQGRCELALPPDQARQLTEELGVPGFADGFDTAYLPATFQALERLKRLSGATPVEDPARIAPLAQAVLDRLVTDRGLLDMFPRPSPGAAPGKPNAVRINTVTFGRVDYLEGPRILLQLEKPFIRNVALPNPGGAAPAFPGLYASPVLLVTVLLYLVLAGLLGLLSLALTLHVKEPAWLARAAGSGGGLPLGSTVIPGGPFLSVKPAAGLLAAYLLLGLGGAALFGPAYPAYLGEVGLAAVAAAWLWQRRVPPEHLGLTRRAWPISILSGLLVGFYAVVIGSIGYPSGPQTLPLAGYLELAARSLLLIGPAREFLLRGVVTTALERQLGRAGAVAGPALIAGLTYLGMGLINYAPAGRALQPLLLEGLLVVPATHALAGLLYLRTRNLAAPVLLSGLVELLPRILRF